MGDGMQWEAERPLRCPAIEAARRRTSANCGSMSLSRMEPPITTRPRVHRTQQSRPARGSRLSGGRRRNETPAVLAGDRGFVCDPAGKPHTDWCTEAFHDGGRMSSPAVRGRSRAPSKSFSASACAGPKRAGRCSTGPQPSHQPLGRDRSAVGPGAAGNGSARAASRAGPSRPSRTSSFEANTAGR